MMMRFERVLMGIVLSGMAAGPVWADEPDATAGALPEAAPAVVEPPQPAAANPGASEEERLREKVRQQIRAQLNGTTWELDLAPEGGGKKEQDTLTFTDRTVTSKRLSSAGYGTSNYSVRDDSGIAVWETMQSKEGEGLAFWRGELYGQKMGGALSRQPKEGAPQNLSFSAVKVGGEAPPAVTETPVAEPAAAVQAPVVESSAPAPAEPKKKKRGWF